MTDCKHKTLGNTENPVCDERLVEIQKLRGWLLLFMEALTKNGVKFPANTFNEITEYLKEA